MTRSSGIFLVYSIEHSMSLRPLRIAQGKLRGRIMVHYSFGFLTVPMQAGIEMTNLR
jgi:hypothetical protein